MSPYMNSFFYPVIQVTMTAMYKPEFVQHNLQGVISAIINEIVEKCDAEGLKDGL